MRIKVKLLFYTNIADAKSCLYIDIELTDRQTASFIIIYFRSAADEMQPCSAALVLKYLQVRVHHHMSAEQQLCFKNGS